MEEKDINELTTEEAVDEALVADDDPIESENVEDVAPLEPEEKLEEVKPEEQPKKAKRKLKKWQIALICVASFIVLVGIGVGLFFLIGGILAPEYKPVEVEFENTRPNYEVTYTASELALIESAMANGASEDTIKEAIAMMYAKANDNKINHADNAITVLRGEGSAAVGINFMGTTITPEGTMIVRGFKTQSGDAFYYQKAAKVVKCDVDAALDIIAAKLNQQERTFAAGDGETYVTVALKGSDAKISKKDELTVIPYLQMGNPTKNVKHVDEENFMKNGNYLDDAREISNFRITKDYIVLKQLEEGQKYIEYDPVNKYYTCRFSLAVDGDEQTYMACAGTSIKYLRESSESPNLKYSKYDVIFEVWDNGYAKKMHDDECWAGDIELLGATSTTSSENWYESIFYYDYDENLFTEEDQAKYEGENWAGKIIADYKAQLKW